MLDMFLYRGEKDEGFNHPTEYVENDKVIKLIGYWRNANQIHNWFVLNVQGGKDQGKPYFVSKDQLKQLLDVCDKVLNNFLLAPTLLPARINYNMYFVGINYNMDYMEQIRETYLLVDKILKETNFEKDVVIYQVVGSQ
jgi:hypothetical protein